MFYPNLNFPKTAGRPFFYTNFVSTVDGKVSGYWPLGSSNDHKVLMELRSYADVLVHGKNLYKQFGEITKKSLSRLPNLIYYPITEHISPKKLADDFYKKGYRNVLVEGGPTLLGSFLKEHLLDEIFLTIAPKIFGSKTGATLTLVEGILFPPNKIKNLQLLSVKQVKNELFLRYRVL